MRAWDAAVERGVNGCDGIVVVLRSPAERPAAAADSLNWKSTMVTAAALTAPISATGQSLQML